MQPLKDYLAETLTFVAPKSWRSTRSISIRHSRSIVSQRAISNRLQELRALGLVECRRVSKEKHWRRR